MTLVKGIRIRWALIALAAASGASAQTFYVDDTAAGANDGSSWANAYTSLQSALGVPGAEVRVGQGTYSPGPLTSDTFNVPAGTMVVGGYAGAGAPNPDDWNPAAYVTTLSGGGNSQHVVTMADGTGVVLDGLAITGGYGPNNVGAGVYIAGGSPTIRRSALAYNSTPNGFGGAIYTAGGVTIDECSIAHNDAKNGGAVYLTGAGTVTNSQFDQNSAFLGGGAIFRTGSSPAIQIDHCEFTSNSANEGGAIQFFNTASGPQITFSNFYGNTATSFGGGVCNLSGGMTLSGCILSGNSATIAGGAVTVNSGNSAVISSCTIADNTTPGAGGGICQISNLTALTLTGSIVWGNVDSTGSTESAQIGVYPPGLVLSFPPVVTNSDVQGFSGAGSNGNIDQDPLFVGGGDYALQSGSPATGMGAVVSQNAQPTAAFSFQQLTDLGQTAQVRLDGTDSSDPDGATDDLQFEWFVDGTPVPGADGVGLDYAIVELAMTYGVHDVTLAVTDLDGARNELTKQITVDLADLSLLEAGKTVVDFKAGQGKGTFSISGEVGLPYGLNYTEVARKAGVVVSVAGTQVGSATLNLNGGCGGWNFSSQNGVGGITSLSIDWTGAKFEYKTNALTIRSDLISSDETVLTVKFNMKKIGGPFALTIDGRATLTVNAQGVASADVPLCDDDHGKEVTMHLPFGITDDSVIAIVGPPYGLIDVGDYLTASIGRYRVEGKFNAALFPAGAATTPRRVDLSLSLGNEGYAGATTVTSAELAVKKDKWQAH